MGTASAPPTDDANGAVARVLAKTGRTGSFAVMNGRVRAALPTIVLAMALAHPLAAQCPDGTAPPCGAARNATLIRHADPPLDARSWIVVPFDNLARNTEVDWLSQASVNLLYVNLSNWKDIRVVDDERVGEIQTEVGAAKTAGPVTRATAMLMAKRVGAGRLVMGDFLKAGTRTAITAKVYDVSTGARLRSVEETANSPDSIIPVYGRLAQKVLSDGNALPANLVDLGTRRLDAYQEYIEGVRAFHHFDLGEARRRFDNALKLDSAFALAHYKLAQTIALASAQNDTMVRAHAAAAARLGVALPARPRALIKALTSEAAGSFGEACTTYRELLRTDSLDVDAVFGLGACSLRDGSLEVVGDDTSNVRFVSSLNVAFQSFKRALELDPSNHLAFEQLLLTLTQEGRAGCRERKVDGSCAKSMLAIVRRLGDSLVTVPLSVGDSTIRLHIVEAARTKTRARNLELARQLAASWTDLAPDEARAHLWLGTVLLRIGRLDDAGRELSRKDVAALKEPAAVTTVLSGRAELAIKQWRGVEAARLVDSVLTSGEKTLRASFAKLYGPALGRLRYLDSVVAEIDTKLPPLQRGILWQAPRVILGIVNDSVAAAEARALPTVTRTSFMANARLSESESFAFGLRLARKAWPILDPDRRDAFRSNLVVALATGDTAAMRFNARMLDSVTGAVIAAQVPDSGASIIAADAYLILGDSVAALRSVRRFLDSAVVSTPFATLLTSGSRSMLGITLATAGWLWPRAALQRADLASALGFKDEARLWYQRFADLWSKADPEFAPMVARARAALAK